MSNIIPTDIIPTVKNNYSLVKNFKKINFSLLFAVYVCALTVRPTRQKIKKPSLNYTGVCSSN